MEPGWFGADVFNDDEILPPLEREKLADAGIILIDMTIDTLDAVRAGDVESVAAPPVLDHLPPKFINRYDYLFMKRFLVCLITVNWKLQAPGAHQLASVAEELALYAMIEEASVLVDDGKGTVKLDYERLELQAHEDADFRMLWDDSIDGIESSRVGEIMGACNLEFDRWFEPFAGRYAHPFGGG